MHARRLGGLQSVCGLVDLRTSTSTSDPEKVTCGGCKHLAAITGKSGSCTCKGTGRLTNRGDGRLVPLCSGESREVTAPKMREFYVYTVAVGEVCPCPCQRELS